MDSSTSLPKASENAFFFPFILSFPSFGIYTYTHNLFDAIRKL